MEFRNLLIFEIVQILIFRNEHINYFTNLKIHNFKSKRKGVFSKFVINEILMHM